MLVLMEDLARAEAAVAPLGFDIRARPMSLQPGVVEIRRISKPDDSGQVLSLDLLLVTDAIRAVWEDREIMDWDFGKIAVVSRDGLISLKSLRGSGLDQDDIKRLRGESE